MHEWYEYLAGSVLARVGERAVATAHAFSGERLLRNPPFAGASVTRSHYVASSPLSVCSCRLLACARVVTVVVCYK